MTDRQREILSYIHQRCKQGLPPTYREIATDCYQGIPENQLMAVRRCVRALERDGFLKLTPIVSRGIQVTPSGKRAVK